MLWDGELYTVANIGQTEVSLVQPQRSGRMVSLPNDQFEDMLQTGKLTGTSQPFKLEIGTGASVDGEYEAIANTRFLSIAPYIFDQGLSLSNSLNATSPILVRAAQEARQQQQLNGLATVSERTLRRWLARYKQAQQTLGSGYDGLIPRYKNRGNRNAKLPSDSLELMERYISQQYESKKQKHIRAVYRDYELACYQGGIVPASYMTFYQHVRGRPLYEQTLRRQGRRAAYRYEPMLLELEYTSPRQGDHPWQVMYIDHTQADVELVCYETGRNLGRPWISFIVGGYARQIPAVFASFDEPSYRTNMMLIRELVRRWGRFPQIVIVDGGKDFQSRYFETLLARYQCVKKTRPGKPRFGSVVERLFGTTNSEFFHNLRGNTQITRNVRQVTKNYNPKGQAIWHLEAFYAFLREWAYEVYDTMIHPALGQSPREALLEGMRESGARAHIRQPYDDTFLKNTLPTTTKGTARVQEAGVKINNIYYSCDAFREPGVLYQDVDVRYDPYDIGIAYAFVKGRWVECRSEYHAMLRGHSEREIALITAAIRDKHRQNGARITINGRKLAEFMTRVEVQESVLEQRLRDLAVRPLFQLFYDDQRGSISYDGDSDKPNRTHIATAGEFRGRDDVARIGDGSKSTEEIPGGDSSDSQRGRANINVCEDL